jgi:predicted  nucleic acid-binding Zn-ribbon protein
MLTDYQKNELNKQLDDVEKKILDLEDKIESARNYDSLTRSQQINIDYAKKDLVKAKEKASKIDYRIRSIKGEETRYRNRMVEIDPVIPPIKDADSSMKLINQ